MSAQQQHSQLVEDLLRHNRDAESDNEVLPRQFFEAVADLTARYATIEQLAFDDIEVKYSPSSLEAELDLKGEMAPQAEHLAEKERIRLDLSPGPILELDKLIEAQGIKIIPRVFPESSRSLGAFFFNAALGPTILLNANGTKTHLDYAMARHFGNFLADFNPYTTCFSLSPEPKTMSDPSEIRAHCFALAFLMPKNDLETYRDALGGISAHLVSQLAVYFELAPQMILWRLLALKWVDISGLKRLSAEVASKKSESIESERGATARVVLASPGRDSSNEILPDRFIQMVAYAFGQQQLGLEEAATFLKVDVKVAQHILNQFHYDESQDKAASRPIDLLH